MTIKVLGWQGSPGPPLVLLLAVLLHPVPSHQTFIDHTGTRFILVFLENRFLVDLPRPKVFIVAAGDQTASVTISVPTSFEPDVTLTVTPGQGVEHSFTSDIQLTTSGINFERVVQVVSDVPVVVQAASLNDLSSDAFLVLPQTTLGTDYVIMSYVFEGKSTGQLQGPSSAAIFAAEKVTVQIDFPNMEEVDVSEIDRYVEGSTLEVELYEYETLQVRSKPFRDLTGARVTSTGPVAVVAGSTWTSVGLELMGDHLVEYLPPVSTWGTSFYTAPVANRTGGDIIRILGHTEETRVRVLQADPDDPSAVITSRYSLNERYFVDVEAPSDSPVVVLASRRVLVAQFCKSHSVDGYRNSDPFMALVPPAAQYTDLYHFITVSTRSGQTSYSNFLNLMCESSKLSGLRLNNAPIPPLALHWGWASVPTASVSVASLSVPNGTYTLSHREPNVTFGAMLYGLQFQESYGQLLGQRLESLTYAQICLSLQAEQEDYFDNDCDGLFDEEIENGLDDDGDGLIDEDVFNDRMGRPQTGDNSSLYYYTAAPRAAGEGDDDTDVTTTDGPQTSTGPVATTNPVTTEQATTKAAPTTTTQPTTTPPTSEAATTPAATTEWPTTTEQATTQHTTVQLTTASVTTQEATTLPPTTTALDTTTPEATTLPDTTLGMTSTVEMTTAEVTTVTIEGPSTPVVTTEPTTEAATTTTEPPTTERQTTTVEPVTTPIATTEHQQSTVQQEASSAAVRTEAVTTEQPDSSTGAASTAAATTRQQQDSSTATHSPLLEVLSPSSRPQPSTARAGTTADPDADFTTEAASLERPVSPTPTGRSVSTLPEDQLKLVIPALILLGIPLIVLTVLITRSCKAAKRARLAAQQGGSPPPPPPPPASSKPAAKAPTKHKAGVVDLR